MPRARNVKPSLYTNEDLAELPIAARYLFIGLWTMADRDGRLEYRPKRIKMTVFPADDLDIEPLLDGLAEQGLIVRYEVEGNALAWIPGFCKHQNPHPREAASTLPAYQGNTKAMPRHDQGNAFTGPARLNPDVLNPDSSSPKKDCAPQAAHRPCDGFKRFWIAYPRKENKQKAFEAWKRKGLEARADELIADVEARKARHRPWLDGVILHATTYINGSRWEDAIDETRRDNGGAGRETTREFAERMARYATGDQE